MKFWAEVEIPDQSVHLTDDPLFVHVDVDALEANEHHQIQFKVLRYIDTDEAGREEK